MRIALVNLKSTFLENPMVFGNLGLWYLAARLESLGHYTVYFDLNVDPIPNDIYDQIFVSATSPQMGEIKRFANETEKYKSKRVLGGAAVWANPDSCRNLGYDLIVGGETDSPHGIAQVLNSEKDYEFIPVSKTLDWVLPPVRRWARKYSSRLDNREGKSIRASTMFTSRGCPMECAFCESGRHGIIWENLVRYEPLDIVEEQIRDLKQRGFGALCYYDDILPMHRKRTIELMKLHRMYDMIWRCFLRSDIIHKHGGYDYLKEMRDGGLVEVFVGVESASNEIKNNITKKTTIEEDTRIVTWCKDLGIRCKVSLIMGLPGESLETIKETEKWIFETRPDRVQLGRLIPFPGTPLTKNPQNYDLKVERTVDDDWFYMGKNDFQHSFVSTSKISTEDIDYHWHRINKRLEDEGIPK